MALELAEGGKFALTAPGYEKIVFRVISKDDLRERLTAELDVEGLPPLIRQFGYGTEVIRVYDVTPEVY